MLKCPKCGENEFVLRPSILWYESRGNEIIHWTMDKKDNINLSLAYGLEIVCTNPQCEFDDMDNRQIKEEFTRLLKLAISIASKS